MKHIGWPHLPKLIVRLMLVDVQLKNEQHLSRIFGCPASKKLLDSVNGFSDQIEFDPAPMALDVYLKDIWTAVESNNKRSLPRTQPAHFGNELKQALLSEPCKNCQASSKCTGASNERMRDDDNLSKFGNCITLLSTLFNIANNISAEFYSRYAHISSTNSVSFETAVQTKAESLTLERAVNGYTVESDRENHRVVRVSICAEEFRVHDYYSALYIVFHECFVHVPCGIRLDSETADTSDRFHDGWMDEVGFLLLNEMLYDRQSGDSAISLLDSHRQGFVERTQSLHHHRLDFLSPNPLALSGLYADGAQAARRFQTICSVWGDSAAQGNTMLLNFSMLINCSTCSDKERASLVNNVNWLFETYEIANMFIDLPDLTTALNAFHQNNDAIALLHFSRLFISHLNNE